MFPYKDHEQESYAVTPYSSLSHYFHISDLFLFPLLFFSLCLMCCVCVCVLCTQVRTEEDAAVKPAYPSDKIRLGRLSFKGESPRMKKVEAVQCFLTLSVGVLYFMQLSVYDLNIDVGIFIAIYHSISSPHPRFFVDFLFYFLIFFPLVLIIYTHIQLLTIRFTRTVK